MTTPTKRKSLIRASTTVKKSNTLKKRQPGTHPAPPVSQTARLPPRSQSAGPILEDRVVPNSYPSRHARVVHVPSSAQLSPTKSFFFKSRPTSRSVPVPRSVDSAARRVVVSLEREETYWPLDLLPDVCPGARISTFGFQTHTRRGRLVSGQLDLFARGRELLDAVDELRRSRRGVGGGGREIVFVAHSTGGIVVKEVSILLLLCDVYKCGF